MERGQGMGGRTRVAARERAALVGLIAGRARRLEAERSLDELGRPGGGGRRAGGAARAAGAAAGRIRPRFVGVGKIGTLAASCDEIGADVVIVRQRADARAAAADRGTCWPQDHRPDAAHPRHLRPARAHARRQAAGGAGAAQVPAAAARRRRHGAVAPGRRHRHARPRRNEARNRPAPDPDPHSRDLRRHRAACDAAAAQLRERRRKALGPDGRARRVHQRRQDDAVQRR